MPRSPKSLSASRPRERNGTSHSHPGGEHYGKGRHGRVFAPGDLRLTLLALVGEQARYGYELIKAIEEEFAGAYAPSPGSVYPTLTLLEETGLIAGTLDREGRRQFAVTAAGRTYLRENRSALEGVRQRMRMVARALVGERPPEAVHQAMHTLKTALGLHRGAWTEREIRRVATVIERAAVEIDEGRGQSST